MVSFLVSGIYFLVQKGPKSRVKTSTGRGGNGSSLFYKRSVVASYVCLNTLCLTLHLSYMIYFSDLFILFLFVFICCLFSISCFVMCVHYLYGCDIYILSNFSFTV